jgi:CDP-glycerol glycerophosphotransferase
MFDLEAYASELRGFYFDIYKTLPGPIVETEDDLLDQLVHHDYDFKRLEAFNEEFNKWHDGTCAKKACDLFLKG